MCSKIDLLRMVGLRLLLLAIVVVSLGWLLMLLLWRLPPRKSYLCVW